MCAGCHRGRGVSVVDMVESNMNIKMVVEIPEPRDGKFNLKNVARPLLRPSQADSSTAV